VSQVQVVLGGLIEGLTCEWLLQTNATMTSTIGGAKEMVGSMLGQSSLEKSGAQQK